MIKDLLELCKGKEVYIQTHNFPDPDAIASAYGLKNLLAQFDIASKLCYEGRIDNLCTSRMVTNIGIEMYTYDEIQHEMQETDYIICVDSQKNSGNITDFLGDEVACIDHHPTFVPIEYRYKDVKITGACATIITEYYRELGIVPDEKTATALLYGLKMDTLQFTRGVTDADVDAFRYLHPLCNRDLLNKLQKNSMEFQDLKAYGAAIERIQIYGAFGFTSIPFACPDALIATLADFILALEEVKIVCVTSRRPDGIKLSVRAESLEYHAGYLVHGALEGLGKGGGHAAMAGGFIPKEKVEALGPYAEETLRDNLLNEFEKMEMEVNAKK